MTHFYMHQEKAVHAEFKLSTASLMFIDIFLITKIARNHSWSKTCQPALNYNIICFLHAKMASLCLTWSSNNVIWSIWSNKTWFFWWADIKIVFLSWKRLKMPFSWPTRFSYTHLSSVPASKQLMVLRIKGAKKYWITMILLYGAKPRPSL